MVGKILSYYDMTDVPKDALEDAEMSLSPEEREKIKEKEAVKAELERKEEHQKEMEKVVEEQKNLVKVQMAKNEEQKAKAKVRGFD